MLKNVTEDANIKFVSRAPENTTFMAAGTAEYLNSMSETGSHNYQRFEKSDKAVDCLLRYYKTSVSKN